MYLLDTHVVSELRKVRSGRADPNVAQWAESVEVGALHLSVVSLMELEIGVRRALRRDAAQGEVLRQWLDQAVTPAFEGRILPVTDAVARKAAELQVPDPVPLADSLIAATALVHRITIVTRNFADFTAPGLMTLDPWRPA